MRLSSVQYLVHHQIWEAIRSDLCTGASWDDVIAALENAKNIAESNKAFGVPSPAEK